MWLNTAVSFAHSRAAHIFIPKLKWPHILSGAKM